MLRQYITSVLAGARYSNLDSGEIYAEVPALRGVWTSAASVEECRRELEDVIEGWILVRVARGLSIPPTSWPSPS
ncbi:MAG: type II toxin-antitoxin system HicB family antitoxin [Planctomycetes bacterium]|nr:type II toxin-antitoxin system HicB family antitoxin [Planctomycetota bacterium]